MNEDIESVLKHCVIIGRSGGGKTFFAQLEALRYHRLGTKVLIVDPGSEYRAICEYVSGSYVSLTEIDPIILPDSPFIVFSLEAIPYEKRSTMCAAIIALIGETIEVNPQPSTNVSPSLYVIFDSVLSQEYDDTENGTLMPQENVGIRYEKLIPLMAKEERRCVIHVIEQKLRNITMTMKGLNLLDSISSFLLFPISPTDHEETILFITTFCDTEVDLGIPESCGEAWLYIREKRLPGDRNNEPMTINAGFTKKEIVGFY